MTIVVKKIHPHQKCYISGKALGQNLRAKNSISLWWTAAVSEAVVLDVAKGEVEGMSSRKKSGLSTWKWLHIAINHGPH